MKKSHSFLLSAWYGKSRWIYCLLPISWLFQLIARIRKFFIVHFSQHTFKTPVIIVGNISIGGTGKTPLIIALVEFLQQQGYKPGVISRGYGGKAPFYPYQVVDTSLASEVGDEPLLIYKATGCPVCVAPNRVAAAQMLIQKGCDIILSDDGLQHYRLGRALELAVIDGQRLFGNGQCLPVGPLREPISRLNSVDFVIVNNLITTLTQVKTAQYAMHIEPVAWREIHTQRLYNLDNSIFKLPIHAVAGIGNPQRFFNTLNTLGLSYQSHEFPDHHAFVQTDINFGENASVVMTEKDAVKCSQFAAANQFSLIVRAQLNADFWQAFHARVTSLMS